MNPRPRDRLISFLSITYPSQAATLTKLKKSVGNLVSGLILNKKKSPLIWIGLSYKFIGNKKITPLSNVIHKKKTMKFYFPKGIFFRVDLNVNHLSYRGGLLHDW